MNKISSQLIHLAKSLVAKKMTVYHGTNQFFDKFDLSKIKEKEACLWGFGVYVTPKIDWAKNYGKYVLELEIDIKNPLNLEDFKSTEELANYLDISEDILQMRNGVPTAKPNQAQGLSYMAKELGHDSIFAQSGNEIVIFDPSKIKIKSYLIKNEQNVYEEVSLSEVNKRLNNPYAKFCSFFNCSLMEELLKPNNINKQGNGGMTALTLATLNNFLPIIKMLIKAGADINLRDWNGKNALFIASERNYLEIVKLLLNAGADVNLKNYMGQTALNVANENKHLEIVQLLKKYGATI